MNPNRLQTGDLFSKIGQILALLIVVATGATSTRGADTLPGVVTGAISVPGERDTFTFTVDAESRFYFDSLTNISSLSWTLTGPSGVYVANRSFAGSDAQSISDPTIALVPGTYSLTIEQSGGGSDAYAFRFLDLKDAALLSPGVVISGNLAPGNSTILYQFTAAAGDQFVFDQLTRVNLPNTYWRLYSPYGQEVFSQGFTDAGTVASPIKLRAAGTYVLAIEGYISDANSGSYSFNVVPQGNVPPVPFTGTPLTLGAIVSATHVANTTNFHTFTLAAQTLVAFDSLLNNSGVSWSLEGPSGLVVDRRAINNSDGNYSFGPWRLPAGNYQLRVQGASAVPYQFRLFNLETATTLTPGTPATAALNPASATVTYKFDANRGERFYFDSTTVTGLPSGYWRLIDPYGNVLFHSSVHSDPGSITIPITGIYTVLIEGYAGETGNGSFLFNVLPAADVLHGLTLGSVVTDTIQSPGQRHQYSFTLPATSILYFDSFTNTSRIRWTLTGPAGTAVNNRSFNGSDAQNIGAPLIGLNPGAYTLTVFPNADDTGVFSFRLFDVATATPLTPGSAVSNTLNPANSTVAYKFQVTQAGRYYFDAQGFSGLPNTYIRLFDSLQRQFFAVGSGQDSGPFDLPVGDYFLLVEGYMGDTGTGNYTFNLVAVQNATQSLTLGNVVTTAIAHPGQAQRYTFTLPSAGQYYFDSLTNQNSFRWSLDGPLGNVVNLRSFSSSDAQNFGAPVLNLSAGNYTLTISGNGDASGVVPFRLLDMSSAGPLAIGADVTGTLDPANSTTIYKFTLPAGGSYFYNYKTSSGLPNGWMRLLDPHGRTLINTSLSTDIGPMSLESGQYYFLVEGYVGDAGVGSYTFNISPANDGAQTLTLGALVSGSISNPGQRQVYTFSLDTARKLVFDSRTTSSSIRWTLRGPLGTIINTRGFGSSDAQNGNPVLDLNEGSYTLTVDASGDTLGAFQFALFEAETAGSITAGVEVVTALNPGNSTAIYQLNVSTEGKYFYDVRSVTGIPNAWLRLIGPTGNLVRSVNAVNDFGPVSLLPGTHYLLVEGYVHEPSIGSITFAMTPVTDGNQALTPGAVTSGLLTAPGQIQKYTFSLATRTRLYFDSLTNLNVLRWSLDGPVGNVVNSLSFTSSDSLNTPNPILDLQPGDYVLSVSTGSDTLTGYQFRLFDINSAASLTPGVTTGNANLTANSTDAYKFNAAAGDTFQFVKVASAGVPNLYWRLVSPHGAIIFGQSFNSDPGSRTLAIAGTYTLLLEGYHSDTGVGSYSLNVSPSGNQPPTPFTGISLPIGATQTGSLASASTVDSYIFTLPAPARLYFDALSLGSFNWSLHGQAGAIINNRSFQSTDSADIADPRLLLPAGDYRINITGAAGTYRFRLLDFASASTMTPGTPVVATLTPASETVFYKFEGSAGAKYYFDGLSSVAGPGSGANHAAYVRVYGPLGNIIMGQYVNSDVDLFTLAQTGTYTVGVEGRIFDLHDSQTNSFNIIPITLPTNAITLGSTINGTSSTPGVRHTYTFTLGSPKTLYFDALSKSEFSWRLDAPWGQVVDWRGFQSSDGTDFADPALRLPAGTYTLTVAGNGFTTTGSFSFRLLDFGAAAPMTIGSIVSTILTGANSTALYQFNAPTGTKLFFDGQGYTNTAGAGQTFPAYIRIYGPSKTVLMAQNVNTTLDTFTLPETGDYTVTVEGRIHDEHAAQTNAFRLIPITYPTNPLILGQTISGTISTPGVRHSYTFTIPASTTVAVDALTNDDFYWRLDAAWGQIVDWRSFRSTDGADVNDARIQLEPGTYTFMVAGSNFRLTGNYNIRLLDVSTAVTMTPGTPVASTLLPANTTVLYKFNGVAGSLYYFDGIGFTNLPAGGPNYAAQVRVYSPSGKLLMSQNVTADIDTFSLPESGTYLVAVEGRIYDDHASQVNSFNLVPVINSTLPLTLGVTVNGTLSTPGIRNTYTITLDSPKTLYFDALTDLDFYWRLDSNLGQFVDWRSFRGSDSFDVADPALRLPAGSYTLTIAWNSFSGVGDYSFRLLDFDSAPTITPGVLLPGSLAPARQTAIARFTGNAGDQYYFDGRPISGFTHQPYVRLYSPYGGILFSQSSSGDVDTFKLPFSGTYYLTVEGRIYDNSASGNYSFILVPVPPTVTTPLFDTDSVPDLVAGNISVTPSSGIQSGSVVTIHWVDENIGTGAAADSFSDRITIRNASNTVLADAAAIYSIELPGNGLIGPGESRPRQATLTLPDGLASVGSLEVTVIADVINNITESNEANNGATGTFTATLAPYPDLVVENVSTTPPQRWIPGSTVTVNWRVRNAGNGVASSDWIDNILVRNVSSSTVIATGNTNYAISGAGNGPIAPGQFRDRAMTFTVPGGNGAYGLFSVVVTADTSQTLFELNVGGTAEQNNSASIETLSAPDLSPNNVLVSSGGPITSGSLVTIQWTDRNLGTVDLASGFYDRVVVTKIGSGEVLFNNQFHFDPANPVHGALAPGDSRNRSTTFTMPEGAAGVGSFQVTVTSDVFNNVSEVNLAGNAEANNVATSSSFSSALAPYPDIQVTGLQITPVTLGAGTNVTIAWKDTNSGNGFAIQSWYDRVIVINTNSGVTLIDTLVHHNSTQLGPLTNGTARNRSFSFTLPNDTDATGMLRFSVSADTFNNVFEFNAGGTAELNNSAEAILPLVATPLPDLVIASISSPASAQANQSVNAQFRIENRGTSPATNATIQRVFISTSPSAGSGVLVSQVNLNSNLAINEGADQSFTFLAPSTPGTYWLIAQADSGINVIESRESNNYLVSPTPFTVLPTYTATVSAGVDTALAGTSIPLTGMAVLTGTSTPAAFRPILLHIMVRGTDRTFQVFSGADGTFSTVFHPLEKEAGLYEVSAAHPALPTPPAQDTFTLIGMSVAPVGVVTIVEGQTGTNVTTVANMSDVPLTALNVSIISKKPNLDVTAELSSTSLGAFGTASLKLTTRVIDSSFIQSPVVLRISSAEGATIDLIVTVRVEPLTPRLVAAPSSLSGVMQRGAQSPRAFTILNQGGIPTSALQVSIPNVPWLSLASAAQLAPMAPGDSNVVTLLLNPAADLPFGDYHGTVVIQGNNASIQVPFSFRAVSTAVGNLLVTAEDEYTYFAAGSPKLADATVSIRDALSGSIVASATTGPDGTALFQNLTEAHYVVDVTATNHNSFRKSALVIPGATTNVVAFLSRQSVQYSFTVTPTTVEDRYTFTVDSVFETQVPVPVVTISPASLDLAQYPEEEFQVQFTISNHGLIDAEEVLINLPSTDRLQFTMLVTNVGKMRANTSVTVPVVVKRLNPAPLAASGGKANDATTGTCSVTAQMLWNYLCGPNVVDKSTAFYVFDSTGCDLVALYRQVYDLVPDGGGGTGGGPVITSDEYFDYLDQLRPLMGFEAPAGYHFECKPNPPALVRSLSKPIAQAGAPTNVCAKVEIRLSQSAVLTRDAFKATLQIDNDVPDPMQNIQVTLQISNLDGVPVTDRFGVTLGDLAGITGVGGSGTLAAQSVGAANWTIVPTLDAAPNTGANVYLVSGTLSYTQDGSVISVPLAPAPIQVYPQPELLVRYFHDRNVYADDPFTPQVEPSVPYSLVAMVQNVGHGAARNLSITGARPEIRENVKGLLVDFRIDGTQLENSSISPSLDVNFGRIEPGTNKIARWLFTSTIQGTFTNFSASFSQVDPFGNPRTSLVRGVEIHELNHIVEAGGPGADGRPDFLANDVADVDFLPDTIHLSNGTNAPITVIDGASVTGTLSESQLTVAINVTPTAGHTYIRFADPGQGEFKLTRVQRANGTDVVFGKNAWTTDRNFRGGDLIPILTNMVHIFEYDSSASYTLTYQSIQTLATDIVAPASAVHALPASSPLNFTVQWSGSDNDGGSGISLYDIYVSTNGGPFGRWMTNTPLTSATFNGFPNTVYAFYSRALDAAGNRELAALTGDASTTTGSGQNLAPSITAIPTQTISEGEVFSLLPAASNDSPLESLTWSLLPGSPSGALISPTTGRITWQTSLGQGGSVNNFTLVAVDNGSPSMSSTQSFNVVVTRLNIAPAINSVAQPIVIEKDVTLSLQLTASDANAGDTLTWQLQPGAPTGVTLTPSGFLSWNTSSVESNTVALIDVTVRDNGTPQLSATMQIALQVHIANRAPVLTPIVSQAGSVLIPLHVSATASDADGTAQLLTFSLDPGAPFGARVNPVTGEFVWNPSRSQARSVNTITVRVTDNGTPALTDFKTFTITVDDFIEILLGRENLFAGQSGELPIGLDLSSPVTNVDFTITVADNRVGTLAVTPVVGQPLASATLSQTGPGTYAVKLRAKNGQALAAAESVVTLQFQALPAAPSGFVPFHVTDVEANRADGVEVIRNLITDGRLVIVQDAPVLELDQFGAELDITIYARPGITYVLESTASLQGTPQWTEEWRGTVDDFFETFTFQIGANNRFYRSRTP